MALAEHHGRSVPFAFNRKEAKDHGEGGNIVGAPLHGRVVIVDDVITAGTAIRESLDIIRAAGAQPVAVALALDRQERGQGMRSAVQELEAEHGLKCVSIITLADLIETLSSGGGALGTHFCGAAHIAQGLPGALRRLLSLRRRRGQSEYAQSLVGVLAAGCAPGAPCLALAVLCAVGVAHADDKSVAYKWVDENGVAHYGDRIPPQYAKKESSVLNKQGVEVGHNDAQKTPDQLAEEARPMKRPCASSSTTASCSPPTPR